MAHSRHEFSNGRVAAVTLSDFACTAGEIRFTIHMAREEGGGKISQCIPVSLLEETIGFDAIYGKAGSGRDFNESLLITKSGSDDEYTITMPVIAKDEPVIVMPTADYLAFARKALGEAASDSA